MLQQNFSHRTEVATDAQRRAATLAALRATLATRRAQALPRPWDDAQLRAVLARVEATATVNPHLPIAWPTWPPGIIPKLVAAGQKIIRALLAWYINPIVAQQNAFNRATTDALETLREALDLLAAEHAHVASRLAEAEARQADDPPMDA